MDIKLEWIKRKLYANWSSSILDALKTEIVDLATDARNQLLVFWGKSPFFYEITD